MLLWKARKHKQQDFFSDCADFFDHAEHPGRFVHFFLERVIVEIIGRNELQAHEPSPVVVDFLDIFHPNLSIVFDGINIVVLDVGDVLDLAANNNVLIFDDRVHGAAGNREGNEAAARDTGDGEKVAVLRRAFRADGRTGEGTDGGEQDIPRAVVELAFGAQKFVARVKTERRADAVEHPSFVDAKHPAEGLRLVVINDALGITV